VAPFFKHLSISMTLVVAACCLFASGASAAEFHSGVHPQTVSGSQSSSHVITTNAGTVTCSTVTFSGTTAAKTSSTQTLVPNYDKCTAFGFLNIAFDENGCAYILNASGTSEIECPSGKQMAIPAPFCTTTIGAQHIASGMVYFNNAGKTDYTLTTHIEVEIDYNECGTNRTNGSYLGATTMQGSSGSVWYE
jgi:hypothetical protein